MPVFPNQFPHYSVQEISEAISLVPQAINRRIKNYKDENPSQEIGRPNPKDARQTIYTQNEIKLFLEPKKFDLFLAYFSQSPESTQENTQETTEEPQEDLLPTSKLAIVSDLPSHLTVGSYSTLSPTFSSDDLQDTLNHAQNVKNTLASNLSHLIQAYTAHKVKTTFREIDLTVEAATANALGKSLSQTQQDMQS